MVHKRTTDELKAERAKNSEQATRTPISVVVDNVRSLDNVGLIFRLCDLARIDKLYLTGYTGHPRIQDDNRREDLIARHERRIMKTAVYALDQQPWEYVEDPVALIKRLKEEQGAQVVALEQTDTSVMYHQAVYRLPLVLVVGHEREGVRAELLELADTIVEIPVLGAGNSHNVATATGIALYKILETTGRV